MIKQVSWDEYFTYLAIGLIIYYSAVLFLFYRGDLMKLLTGKRKLVIAKVQGDKPGLISDTFSDPVTEENQAMFGQANQLISELKEIFQNDFIKEELIMALQLKLREYPALRETAFKISINNYIERESEKRFIPLSEEDLRVLW